VIIDDTGNPKSGDFTHATRKQWIGSLGKVGYRPGGSYSHYVDSRKDWPIGPSPISSPEVGRGTECIL